MEAGSKCHASVAASTARARCDQGLSFLPPSQRTVFLAILFILLLCISNHLERIMSCNNEDEQTNSFAGQGPIHLPSQPPHSNPRFPVWLYDFDRSPVCSYPSRLRRYSSCFSGSSPTRQPCECPLVRRCSLSVHRAQSNLPHPIVKSLPHSQPRSAFSRAPRSRTRIRSEIPKGLHQSHCKDPWWIRVLPRRRSGLQEGLWRWGEGGHYEL